MAKQPTKKAAVSSAPSTPKAKEKVSKGYTVTFGKGVTIGKGAS